jgi:hypothetical protein
MPAAHPRLDLAAFSSWHGSVGRHPNDNARLALERHNLTLARH